MATGMDMAMGIHTAPIRPATTLRPRRLTLAGSNTTAVDNPATAIPQPVTRTTAALQTSRDLAIDETGWREHAIEYRSQRLRSLGGDHTTPSAPKASTSRQDDTAIDIPRSAHRTCHRLKSAYPCANHAATRSAIIIIVRCPTTRGTTGKIDASTTDKLPIPRTRHCWSSTASGLLSAPIGMVPSAWQ
jgi:hypothetical protein